MDQLSFMVISLPRSGSTWISNFLTFDGVRCFHDPLRHTKYDELDTLCRPGLKTGVADTGLWLFPEWVNAHPARKLILLRDHEVIQDSLISVGMDPIDLEAAQERMDQINGLRLDWKEIFSRDSMEHILEYLFPQWPPTFDRYRFRELVNYRIEPMDQYGGFSPEAIEYNTRHVLP